ncbi:MAG: FAD-binding oxidoreductase [Akkermansiaceae bacterium]|nr:FAD-binding oxidoreductase [Akkermansiaceae bacterium]
MKRKTKRRYMLIILLITALASSAFLVSPLTELSESVSRDKHPNGSLPCGHADDASRLNKAKVNEIWEIPVDHENPEAQIAELLERARKEGLKVSIAGAKHSMGGHTIYPGGIVINTTPWKHMELDTKRNLLKVEAGALWEDIIPYLNTHGKSVSIMQSNNSFSVGGSISVNCHGWQYDRPPIASSVESFRIMLADGSIKHCCREQNQELFSLALGGYGLFGIILDVELRVVANETYRLEQYIVPVNKSLGTFDNKIKNQPGLEMVYARMNIVPDDLLGEVILNAFYRMPQSEGSDIGVSDKLLEPSLIELRRAVFRGSAESYFGKKLRWNAETKLQPSLKSKSISRNQLLNESVEVFENRTTDTTDILHEYFVPRHRAASFVNAMRRILERHEPNLLNVTVRSVNRDDDTFLRYADRQMIAFVMLYVQEKTHEGEDEMRALTRDLINASLRHKGRYYLPYRLHATHKQFHRAYPQASEFFALKRKYDPEQLFQNQFYLKYGSIDETL